MPTPGKCLPPRLSADGPDAAVYDASFDLAFSSNGRDGTLTVINAGSKYTSDPGGKTPGKLPIIQRTRTQFGARTMALDPLTHNIYLVTAHFAKSADDHNKPAGRAELTRDIGLWSLNGLPAGPSGPVRGSRPRTHQTDQTSAGCSLDQL